ncbi:hypothetical protein Tco_1332283 [Tanacetum coccineum]
MDTSSAGGSTGGSQSESLSGVLSQDYRRKCEAAEAAYEAKRKKELGSWSVEMGEFPMWFALEVLHWAKISPMRGVLGLRIMFLIFFRQLAKQ